MAISQTFGKHERLHSNRGIEKLFASGRRFNIHPMRVLWRVRKEEEGRSESAKILISVPKKSYSRSVDRNLIKRRIREAYRKNKFLLTIETGKDNSGSVELAFIYNGREIPEYHELEIKVISALQTIVESLKVSS
jgi:ribonuclease P protein component